MAIGRKTEPIFGWLCLLAALFAISLLAFWWGYPLGFKNIEIFSPEILNSGGFIFSLVDLILHLIFELWLLTYLAEYVSIRKLIIKRSHSLFQKLPRLALLFGFFMLLFFEQPRNIRNVIVDSKISYHIGNLLSVSSYSIIGIILICVITIICGLSISFITSIIRRWFKHQVFQILFFLAIGGLIILVTPNKPELSFYLGFVVACAIIIILINRIGVSFYLKDTSIPKAKSSPMYFWLFFYIIWGTLEVFYINYNKEKELRKVFATQQIDMGESVLQRSFNQIKDTLKALEKTDPDLLRSCDRLSDFIQKEYQSKTPFPVQLEYKLNVNLLDDHYRLICRDSLEVEQKGFSEQLLKSNLSKDTFYGIQLYSSDYVGLTALNQPGEFSGGKANWAFLTFIKRQKYDGANGRLLMSSFSPSSNEEGKVRFYSWGMYKDRILKSESEGSSFPVVAPAATEGDNFYFRESATSSNLIYTYAPGEKLVVRYERDLTNSFFSVLIIVVLVWSVVILLRFIFNDVKLLSGDKIVWRNLQPASIRTQVNLTIIFVVTLSIVVVGGLSLTFLKNKYQEVRMQSLEHLASYLGQNIISHFAEIPQFKDLSTSAQERENVQINQYLKSLLGEEDIDVHLYDRDGYLIGSTLFSLAQDGYLKDLLDPKVMENQVIKNHLLLVEEEAIGGLRYKNIYLPLLGKNRETIGYLSLPYYGGEMDLRESLAKVYATLTNVYLVVVLIAVFAALLISNNILRSFHILGTQFRKVRLEHNKMLNWPYESEFSLLVTEYNKMVEKVEEMAIRLANSEREEAWKELALQVAHEIKNPLTPMKLKIQHLHRMIEADVPDIRTHLDKTCSGLIEQIDYLNLIATEFSKFSRLPEANPELILIEPQLMSLINIFKSEEVSITIDIQPVDVKILMDKSNFIRVFTNLFKNALQALRDTPDPTIHITAFLEEERLFLNIRDNGAGMSEEVQKKVFTPHFTTKSSGMGVGLVMVRRMVMQAKGFIYFTSEVGNGTVFRLVFPAVI